jgi:hypothetical protein
MATNGKHDTRQINKLQVADWMWTGVGIWLSVTWSEDRWSTKNQKYRQTPS